MPRSRRRSAVAQSRRSPAEPARSGRETRASVLSGGSRRRPWSWIALLGILAAAAWLYGRLLDHPLVYDDLRVIRDNDAIHGGSAAAIFWRDAFRPLVNFSYAGDLALFGAEPRSHHLGNLVLHLAATVLVWRALLAILGDAGATGRRDALAVAGAGIFALHPLASEAVTYAAGRSEVLAGGLVLGAFLLLREGVRRRPFWTVPGLLCWLAALASKETAAMLPPALLAWDRLLVAPRDDPRRARRRLFALHGPLLLAIAAGAIARVAVYATQEHPGLPRDPLVHLRTEVVVFWRYLRLIVAPYGQSLVHDVRPVSSAFEPRFLLALGGVVALLAGAAALRRRQPAVAFGLCWFVLFLLPSSSFVPLEELMAEHRVYLALPGLLIAAAAATDALLASRRRPLPRPWGAATIAALLALLAVLTARRLEAWRDPVSLWEDAARKAPRTGVAFHFLGNARRDAGDCPGAIVAWQRAIELWPDELGTYMNLGICRAQTGDLGGAERAFRAAWERDPRYVPAHNNLGRLALAAGDPAGARSWFESALALDPRDRFAAMALAALLRRAGDEAGARAVCEHLVAAGDPTPVEACLAGSADVR